MIKKLLFCTLLFHGICHAQQNAVKYYVDIDEKPTTDEKKARYQAVIYKLLDTDILWQREVYYKASGSPPLRSVGYCKDSMGLIKEGEYIYYSFPGKKETQGKYKNNKKDGDWISWNSKGNISAKFHYTDSIMTGANISWHENGSVRDSCMLDETGTGRCKGYYDDGKFRYEGYYINGLKNGEWNYFYQTEVTQKSMTAVFSKDKMVKSNCFMEDGSLQTDSCIYEQEASFPGGQPAWVQYLSNALQRVQTNKYIAPGSRYQALIWFVIDKNGTVSEAKIEKPGIEKLDMEAQRIIKKSPRWNPAIQYNQKVKAYRRQPITFTLE
ncbi:MAG: energy transducer TonB [Ferruginibacter sp.]